MSKKNDTNLNLSSNMSLRSSPQKKNKVSALPRFIFDKPYTTAVWEDGTAITVKTYKEKYYKEHGAAMAVVKRLFGGHSNFKKAIKEGIVCHNHKDEK